MSRVVVGLVALVIVGCGSEAQEANVPDGKPMEGPLPATEGMSAEEKAVLRFAGDLYRGQNLESASCEKVGFSPNGDLFECSLTDSDGLETEPREWTIARSADGGIAAALPSDGY